MDNSLGKCRWISDYKEEISAHFNDPPAADQPSVNKPSPDQPAKDKQYWETPKPKPFECTEPGCGWKFNIERHLTNHTNTVHKNSELFKCTVPGCPKTYKDERSVTRHINTEHENLRFECKVCGDKVTTEKILADHIKRTHENLRPFNCTVPGCKSKPFATEKDLREHNRGVHGVRVECTLCGQTFARKKHLTGHMVRKHPEDKLKCEVPGCRSKAFATESELTEHTKRIHEKYNCTVPGCEDCLEEGACFNPDFVTTYVAGCTDKEYQDPICPQKFYDATVWSGLIYCDGDKKWMPCIQNNDYPDYITKNPAKCDKDKVCPNTDVSPALSTFTASVISNVVKLPEDLDKSSLNWLVSDPSSVYHTPSTTSTPTITSSLDSASSQATSTAGTGSSTSTPSAVPPGPIATSSTDDSSNLSTGAIVGISLTGFCAILVLVGLAIFFIVRRRRAEDDHSPSGTDGSANTADDVLGKESKSPISPGGNSQDLHASPNISELDPQTDRPWSLRSELHGNTVSPSAFSPATTSHASFQPSPLISEASEGQGYAMGHTYKPYGGDHLQHINELPG
ncbi:hypothetical protein B0H65DRAFT_445218 [Neurospora tetraspora]|uniref:C2H2-type domain-containing protein n=1 Tax=Neurospora tetraspora TaxID=94610 RepID=A0AAE0J8I1_9PEZI|nr:hypothetical protein B0H65DRAFT_445218 [Neurospora tetraspora]